MQSQQALIAILIVDDDAPIRHSLRDLFEAENYRVLEAGDGADALVRLHGLSEAVVIISDHQMPRLDGEGLFQAIKHDPTLNQPYEYIYITADPGSINALFVRELSASGVPILAKPFDLTVLLDAVADAARRLQR